MTTDHAEIIMPEDNRKEKRDLFNYKWIANFYRSKHYPLSFQIFLIMALVVFVYDGFIGPESSDENLLTLALSGVFWYPVIFASLFFAGRSWCAVCPVGAISGAANRFSRGYKFPRLLSNWGLPLIAFLVTLWGFREFGIDVLRDPFTTAIWITGVIGVAIAAGLLFKGRVFCKYMCPISAPLAVMSRVAPLEVRTRTMATRVNMSNKQEQTFKKLPVIRENSKMKTMGSAVSVGKIDPTCKSCKTHDCYKGNDETEGCPWEQHPSTMTSNSACSMCMKCTHSCSSKEPMRLRLRAPFSELWQIFRPNAYEAFTILALIGIFNTFLWHETIDLIFPGFAQSLTDGAETLFPFLSEKQVERGIIRYVMSIGLVVGLYSAASLISSKLSGQKFKLNFANFAYSYLAAFLIYGIVSSTFGQIANNGGTFITAALSYIGVYLYIPSSLVDLGSSEVYSLKWTVEAAIAAIIGGYVSFRIAQNLTKGNIKRTILGATPHILMLLMLILMFTTIEPRWA